MNLGIVAPCYNEQAVLPETAARRLSLPESLGRKGKISAEGRSWFVDDGSRDDTWRMLESIAARDSRVRAIKLSRNRGRENALRAGLLTGGAQNLPATLSNRADVPEFPQTKFTGRQATGLLIPVAN